MESADANADALSNPIPEFLPEKLESIREEIHEALGHQSISPDFSTSQTLPLRFYEKVRFFSLFLCFFLQAGGQSSFYQFQQERMSGKDSTLRFHPQSSH
jgi:hypothetical protein